MTTDIIWIALSLLICAAPFLLNAAVIVLIVWGCLDGIDHLGGR